MFRTGKVGLALRKEEKKAKRWVEECTRALATECLWAEHSSYSLLHKNEPLAGLPWTKHRILQSCYSVRARGTQKGEVMDCFWKGPT